MSENRNEVELDAIGQTEDERQLEEASIAH